MEIIKNLQNAGHEAYWAGGCVRDFLLGKEPMDFDIVTSAKPDEIENLMEKTIPIGKKFGVILAIENGHHFEIATFRSDSGYSDGRRPDAIEFTNAEEDARRRDFTINGLFFDPLKDRVLDFVGGQEDLKNRLIRFIGNPKERIQEDYLRILRAIRFKNTLDFMYHPDTYKAVEEFSGLAGNVSQDRLRDEVNRMLINQNRIKALRDLSQMGVLKDILPEVEDMKGVAQPYETHMEGDVFEHSIRSLAAIRMDANLELIWAVLLHDVGKVDTFAIKERIRFDKHCERSGDLVDILMRRLSFPLRSIKKVKWLVKHHFIMVQLLEMPEGRKRHWFTHEWFIDLLELFRCDAAGQEPVRMELYDRLENCYHRTLDEIPQALPKLLDGADVMRILGMKAGQRVGEILEKLLHAQLEGKIRSREEAENFLKNLGE